jgi:predicted ATPase/DNA-binding SARP family transcriptional activator/Tfp pilus assembly protein PilF
MNLAAAKTLHIHLLGEFHLLADEKPVTGLSAERPQTLLAYLLLHGHAPQPRQHLAFLLWPDSSESQARTNLRNLLHTLRQVLPSSDHFLIVEPLTLQWQMDQPFTLDVIEFERAVHEAEKTDDVVEARRWLETAVSLYRGDLLPGNYDDWIIPRREELRQKFLGVLEKLVRLLEQAGDYRPAIHHAQRLLQQDVLNEGSYIQLMRLHALSNDRASVRRVYQTCVTTLEKELGVEPAPATQAAYEQLLRLDVALPEDVTAIPPQPAPAPVWRPRPLPVPATPFIGRESELAEIAELLADPDCRLLTIVGLGGMGKTRLALQTAVGHQPIFRDGVAYVPLAPLQIADLLVTVIGDALQFNFFASGDPSVQLFHFLNQKEMLLVLDNFEHLLESAEMVSALLSAAPHVKVLITSRQRLDLQGEWVYEIGGLPLPEIEDTVALADNSAITLFLQSARRADSRFMLTPGDEDDVVRICRLVGGMPLAIELAASWVRLLSCAEIAGEIERGLAFLAVSLRNIPERHRSIQTVFDHTWHLLTPSEQQTLAQLSVFRGGFTREAAEQVAGATLPLLSALVDKSLVRRSENGRYDLHELIRQYAYDLLVKSYQFEETGNRHFDYFLALAEESKSRLRGSELILWLDLLEKDYDNLRYSLEWSLKDHTMATGAPQFEAYRGQKALRLTAALYLFWKIRVYWGNGRQWLQRALDLAPRTPATLEQTEAIKAAVLLAVEQMDIQAARKLADEGLTLAQELGDPHNVALAYGVLGIVLWKQKQFASARHYCEEALAQFRKLGNKIRMADSLQALGRIAMNQDDLEAAQPYLEECLAIFQELDDQLGFNAALSDLGLLAYLRGDYSAARLYHEKSLRLFREARSIAGIEMTLNRMGDIARCENDYEEARRCYTECFALFRDTGDKDEIPSLLHNLGYVALHCGEYSEAMELFRQGLDVHIETGNQAGIAECLTGIAAVLTVQGQAEKAAHLFGAAETLREKAGAVLWPANRVEYDRSLTALHHSLNKSTLSAAWKAGQTMTVEQIYSSLLPELVGSRGDM